MKTIAIIGGMGPQASLFAHSRLQEELIKQGKLANVMHVSLNIEPFHSSEPTLNLSNTQKELLWPYQG